MSERSRSRSPLRLPIPTIEMSKAEDPSTEEGRFMYMANVPRAWVFKRVRSFIFNNVYSLYKDFKYPVVSVHIIDENEESKTAKRVVQFLTEEACQRALKDLDGVYYEGETVDVEGNAVHRLSAEQIEDANKYYRKCFEILAKKEEKRKLALQKSEINLQSINKIQFVKPAKVLSSKKINPEVFVNHETYGLAPKVLADLGIMPPLDNIIYIENLSSKVTETKLREVFSYAGTVLAAHIFIIKSEPVLTRKGKVLYDHPVEAVQAIAMFNNRELYNMPMRVTIDRFPGPVLPDGLSSIGKGLGPSGAPLTGVRNKMELEAMKKLLMEELAKLQENSNRQQLVQQQTSSVNPQDNALTSAVDIIKLLYGKLEGNLASAAGNTQAQQSRFDIPSNPLVLFQNPLGTQPNPISVDKNALTNIQQNMVQSQPTPRSRFDMPPPALTMAQQNTLMTSNVLVQNWGAGQNDWSQQSQTQSLSQPSSGNNTTNYGTWTQVQPPPTQVQPPQTQGQHPQTLVQPPQTLVLTPQTLVQPPQTLDQPPQTLVQPPQTLVLPPQTLVQPPQTQAVQSESGTCGKWVEIKPPQMQKPQRLGKLTSKPDKFGVESDSNKSGRKGATKSTDMVLFKNLPASVTSQALVNKMSEVGELKFAEMTGAGCAVIRFQNVRDAERCIQLYNRSKVDGQIIFVKFF